MPHIDQILRKNTYSKQLQSERWRNFSATIRRDRNFCEMCKQKGQLQVHHLFYDPSREAWEYTAHEVVVLCVGCHKQIHEQLNLFRRFVFCKMTPRVFQVINGSLAVAFDTYDPLVFAHALAEFVSTPSMIQRYAAAWDVDSNGNPKP